MQPTSFSLPIVQSEMNVHHWPATEPTVRRGSVLLIHGMAEHSLRYAHVAQALCAKGLDVFAPDLRGHGKTAKNPEELGFFANDQGWLLLLQDILALYHRIQQSTAHMPVFLLGHSMGSFIVQHLLFEHSAKFAGAILSAPVGDAGIMRSVGLAATLVERLRQGPSARSTLLSWMSFGDFNRAFAPNRTDHDWLSRDPDQVDLYLADPQCGFPLSNQMWIDVLYGLGEISKPALRKHIRKDLPVYMLSGDCDPVTEQGKKVKELVQAYLNAGLQDVSIHLYHGARHECFNEINRDEVIEDLLFWLERVLPRISS
ncbi:MAG: alpha/beta hydrolase [Myxococcota bacterium]